METRPEESDDRIEELRRSLYPRVVAGAFQLNQS